MTSNKTNAKPLTVFGLTMITIGSVDSIRNLPATALFGSQLIVFFILGAIFFLLPAALVSAELASGWPKQGGIYIWVRQAFGKRWGFLAIWLQWIENVIWYPTLLSFVAGTIGYLINPELIKDKTFLWLIIIVSFWAVTLINLAGMKASSFFSSLCALCGLLLPMTLIITLGAIWIMKGNPIQIHFDIQSMMPSTQDKSVWVSLTAIMLSFCGIEIATVHANDVNNPQRAFPKALMYSVVIIVSTLILGSLAIAIVLPNNHISLVAGIMQAFDAFFNSYHMRWLMPYIAVMLVLGGLGGVNNWIIAPTKGLLVAAQDEHLPPVFTKENTKQAPINLLIAQAVIVSILSTCFLFMPTINSSYWLLTALAAQLYMLMYLIMFATVIVLRLKEPDTLRPFKIPGGFIGVCIVAGFGIIGAVVTLLVSFIPPDNFNIGNASHYEMILCAGFVLMCLPPFITDYLNRKKLKHQKSKPD